jgi:uncharacterized protein (TIGR01244 family)
MSTQSIFNYIEIDNRIGTGGQPTKEQLEAARDEGYQAVINLAPSDAQNNALIGEAEIVQSLGMAYRHIPVEWNDPRRDHFEAFMQAMESVKGQRVLIHCAANYRVTAFFSLYAMKHLGWSVAQADALIAKIWESHPDYRMEGVWKVFLDEMRK